MNRTQIKTLLNATESQAGITVKGWLRTRRDGKGFSFLEINDGSCLKNIQIIAEKSLAAYDDIRHLSTGSALSVTGDLIESPGTGQAWEIRATSVEIISSVPDTYPLQKKRHTDEFLRTIAHLRPRTNKYGAIFRIRSELSHAIHLFFRERGFRYIHAPIITGSDCEGAGQLFHVTSIDFDNPPLKDGKIDNLQDFFGTVTNLSVSGQLNAEMMALALGDVYTFGPTFRAENSNTSRHVAEFWMVEPEMAFCDLQDNMQLAEDLVKFLVNWIIDECHDDLQLFARFVCKDLMQTLEGILSKPFKRLTYAEAVEILQKSGKKFQYPVAHGLDLQSEHERFLTEVHFKRPVILIDFPASIKPFYMRLNDDEQTVAAMDVLTPKIGEIIGGSQREERLHVLENRMDQMGISKVPYWWYLDSRRYGSVPHSGFGLGFERMLMLLTGVSNIRDVIPFPRTPKSIEF